MKLKLLLSTVVALSIISIGGNVKAQQKHPQTQKKAVQHKKAAATHKVVHKNSLGESVRVIKRTNHVISNANRAVKKYNNYTGNLSRAYHHQQLAKSLLKNHKSHRAMQHSRLARKYAFKAIRSNKGTVNKEYNFSDEENKAMGETIADTELDKELKGNNPSLKFDDSAITDKEMTELEVLDIDPSDYKNK